jgi:hypothetical protein
MDRNREEQNTAESFSIDVSGVNIWSKTQVPEGYIQAEFIRLEITEYGVRFFVQPDGYKQARISIKPPDPNRAVTLQNWKKLQRSFDLPTRYVIEDATFVDKKCWIFCEHGSGYNGYDYYCFVSEGMVNVGRQEFQRTGSYPETNKNRSYSYTSSDEKATESPFSAPPPSPPVQHPRIKEQDENESAKEEIGDPLSDYDPNDPNSGIPF